MRYMLGRKNSIANRLSRCPLNKEELFNKPLKNIKKFINTELSAVLYSMYSIKLTP